MSCYRFPLTPSSYTGKPEGKVTVQLWEKTSIFKSDDIIGEVVVDIGFLSNGKPDEKDYTLSKEPKKKTGTPGSLKLKLHYPMPESAAASANASAPSSKKRSINDIYTFGEELGR